MPGFSQKTPISLTLALPLALAASTAAHAQTSPSPTATIPVSNCNNGGPGSLRAAVASAASGDTIDLRSLECRRVVLSTGAIQIPQNNLTLLGPTRAFTIDGNRASQVLRHTGTGTLRLRAMTVANGNHEGRDAAGGCIGSAGDLRLEYTRVLDCRLSLGSGFEYGGAGIAAADDIALYDSQVSRNIAYDAFDDYYPHGGGIWAKGHLTLVRSLVSDNRAEGGQGGGIHAGGGLLVQQSEISGNFAYVVGAMYASGDEITVANSLIADNSAWSDYNALLYGSDTLVVNTTVSGNSAYRQSGLTFLGGSKSLLNSTIAANDERGFHQLASCVGALSAQGSLHMESTIVARNTCGEHRVDITDNFDGASDPMQIVGSDNLVMMSTVALPSDTISVNPRISPLADNGGRTRTHALWAGSPAVDMGNNNAGLEFDQRGPGFDRVNGTRADIGAYER